MIRRAALAVCILLSATLLLGPGTAGADTAEERAEVQRKRAEVAAEIDTLRATDEQVERALAVLQDNVRAQEALLRDAERATAEALAALARATDRVTQKEAEITDLEAAVREVAIAAYIRPSASTGILDALDAENIGEAELRQALIEARTASQFDLLDQLARAREDLEFARVEALDAAAAAERHQAEVDAQLGHVTQARDQQAAVAADIQNRLDHRLSEAANLAALDRQLADQIAAEQARLAAQLGAGGVGGPGDVTIVGEGEIVSVRGIQVHTSIAQNLASMLEAADADGIFLSGGGYRSTQRQIELRRAHCGSSNYDIYEKPPSQCSPPTARPGSSLHEKGLAIDFTYQGRAISSRSSPAYVWLRDHAAGYGFYNLPSEPWHWSVNGN